jgi:hypothetical protein
MAYLDVSCDKLVLWHHEGLVAAEANAARAQRGQAPRRTARLSEQLTPMGIRSIAKRPGSGSTCRTASRRTREGKWLAGLSGDCRDAD